jgi:hypothetical protein
MKDWKDTIQFEDSFLKKPRWSKRRAELLTATGNVFKKKWTDVVYFVIGPILFAVGFFGGFQLDPKVRIERVAIARGRLFCPSDFEITLMAFGVGLICLGFVTRSWKTVSRPKETESIPEEKANIED